MTRLLAVALWALLSAPNVSDPQTLFLDPTQSTAAIQAVFDSAQAGDTVQFAAGTYSISSPLYPPCGAHMSGPLAVPATAILSATFAYDDIFKIDNCTVPTTIKYLQFANTGGIYVTAPSAGLTVAKSQFTSLPANHSFIADSAIYFDGRRGGTVSNATITNNTFGDPSSCNAVMSVDQDMGGLCAGVLFQSDLDGVAMEKNVFTHLEEGYHVLCYGNLCQGNGSPTWNNFIVQWNDFNNIHRIAMEMQPQNASNVTVQYNSYENAFAPSRFSMGISAACCAGLPGVSVPLINDNVLLANTPPAGDYIAYAIEWWGNGAQADNNLIQGYWENGIVWGWGGPPWEVRNTTIEGPYMAGPYGCYVCDEKEGATSVPTQSGNTESTTVTPLTSVAPEIVESDGRVVISDAEPNASIYYTIDGSTPTTASTLYTRPFTAIPGSTVQAIGMWGKGANPKSYPAGYGYIPSGVVSKQITEDLPAPDSNPVVGAYLGSKGNVTTIQRGGTVQFVAHAIYSDGSAGTLPDAVGNAVTAWDTSSHAIAKVSSHGHVTAMGVGTVIVTAVGANIGTLSAQLEVTDRPDAGAPNEAQTADPTVEQ